MRKWKIGIEDEDEQVYLQIWRPNRTGYSRVAETVYANSRSATIAEVTTDMTVSAMDVIGFFIPRLPGGSGLRLAWAPVPGHTLLQGMWSGMGVNPVATFSDVDMTLSSSPLVSVMFGECDCVIACCVSSSVSHV